MYCVPNLSLSSQALIPWACTNRELTICGKRRAAPGFVFALLFKTTDLQMTILCFAVLYPALL